MTAAMPRPGDAARDGRVLPARPGPRSRTTPWAPPVQEDQNAPAAMGALLARRAIDDLEHLAHATLAPTQSRAAVAVTPRNGSSCT